MSEQLIKEYERKKWEHYALYKDFDRKISEERKKIVQECPQHIWERDRESFDSCRTHMYCTKCGAYR